MKQGRVFSSCTHHRVIVIFSVIMTLLTSAVFAGSMPSDKLVIYTVNYPLKYFTERIAGEHAEVVFPAPADVDPAYWMPDRKTIASYQKADLILLNGAHYAKWTGKVTLPRSKMVNTSKKFRDRYVKVNEAVTHSHGPGGEHAHEDVAFTTWLDFELAAKQAKEIEKVLSLKRPDLRDTFQKNYVNLEKELMSLDKEMKGIVSKDPGKPFVVSHPVYDYFAHRYALNIRSVHWEPDEVPGGAQWMELQNMLRGHPARWMIWEGKPVDEPVKGLKLINVESIVFDPCGNVPDRGDFLSVMRRNVENLRGAYK
jgi:zinc transport system substrate-binding protein